MSLGADRRSSLPTTCLETLQRGGRLPVLCCNQGVTHPCRCPEHNMLPPALQPSFQRRRYHRVECASIFDSEPETLPGRAELARISRGGMRLHWCPFHAVAVCCTLYSQSRYQRAATATLRSWPPFQQVSPVQSHGVCSSRHAPAHPSANIDADVVKHEVGCFSSLLIATATRRAVVVVSSGRKLPARQR